MTRSEWMNQVRRLARIGRACAGSNTDVGEAVASDPIKDHNRRHFMQAIAGGVTLAGVAAAAPPLLAATAADARRLHAQLAHTRGVAVIGAGLAGLTCATELARLGIPNQVFEAAARVGGRCWSGRQLFAGQVVEHGAEFIGSSHYTMQGYAQALNLPLETVDNSVGKSFHHFAGQQHSLSDIADEFKAFSEFIGEDLATLGGTHAENFGARAEALDFMSLDEYLSLYGASGLLRSVLGNAFRDEFGSELEDVSTLAFLRFTYGDQRTKFASLGTDRALRVVGGNDLIASGLAQRLPTPAQLQHRLVALSRRWDGTVRASFDNRGRIVQRDFDAVVLALPFPVLRSVQMQGFEISPWKQQAIEQSEMGEVGRLQVGFSRAYWRDWGANGSGRADLPGLQSTWESRSPRAGVQGAVITHQLGGQAARALSVSSAQADAADFVASLEEVLPGAMRNVARDRRGAILASSHNWTAELLSLGAFPRPQPGYFTRIAHAEATPVQNLFFAGDHTSSFYEWQGFMEGAALSGLRAANEAFRMIRGV